MADCPRLRCSINAILKTRAPRREKINALVKLMRQWVTTREGMPVVLLLGYELGRKDSGER